MIIDLVAGILAGARDSFEKKRELRRWRRLQEMGMHIGKDVSLPSSTYVDTSHCYLISIGDRCRFGPCCSILSHDALANEFLDAGKIGRVIIRESCSFGMGTIILPAVEIGPRVIAAAGSVIGSNIPPDSVVAGNPAKVVAKLSDYLRYHKLCMKRSANFPYEEYGIGVLPPGKVKDLLSRMNGPFGYITGGYTYDAKTRANRDGAGNN